MNTKKAPLNFSDNILTEKIGNYGFIFNTKNRNTTFLNEEIYDALIYAVEKDLDYNSFINIFESEDDKEYVKKILENMYSKGEIAEGVIEKKRDEKVIDCVSIMMTDRCNLSCRHCCFACSPYLNNEIDGEALIKFITDLNNKNSLNQLIISGGEPLLHKNFERIVVELRKILKDCMFILSTNATLIDEDKAKFISAYFDKVDISIDGYNEETTSRVRGKGVFLKVVDSINILKSAGIENIHLSATVGNNNDIFDTEEFYKLNDSLGTMPLIRKFTPVGRGVENKLVFNRDTSVMPMREENLDNHEYTSDFEGVNGIGCNAAQEQIYIDAKGDIFPCPSLTSENHRISNIYKEDVVKMIYRSVGGFELFNSECAKTNSCSKCSYKIMCWNCAADIKRILDNGEMDTWCEISKKRMRKLFG